MPTAEHKRTKVFISYSHKDRKWMERFQDYLKSMSYECPVNVWDDTKIAPGSKWKREIESAVNSAKVAVLFVSVDFLGSKFITENELQPLLAAAEAEDAKIIPVIVGPCRYKRTKGLSQFQAFNEDRPLSQMRKAAREKLFDDLAGLIEDVMLAQGEQPAQEKSAERPDGREAEPDGRKCEDIVAAMRELLLGERLSKYELVHLKKLAGDGPYTYKISGSFRDELRQLRDKGFIRNPRVPIADLPAEGDLKQYLELTSHGKRLMKMRQIVLDEI